MREPNYKKVRRWAAACLAGLLDRPEPAAAAELVPLFSWDKVPKRDIILA